MSHLLCIESAQRRGTGFVGTIGADSPSVCGAPQITTLLLCLPYASVEIYIPVLLSLVRFKLGVSFVVVPSTTHAAPDRRFADGQNGEWLL